MLQKVHRKKTMTEGQALRKAEYASLTSRAATEHSRALADEVYRLITECETRKRQRGTKAKQQFRQAIEGFLGDLLGAIGEDNAVAWVYHPTSQRHFTDDVENWSRLSEQLFRVDKWSVCRG